MAIDNKVLVRAHRVHANRVIGGGNGDRRQMQSQETIDLLALRDVHRAINIKWIADGIPAAMLSHFQASRIAYWKSIVVSCGSLIEERRGVRIQMIGV